MLTPHSNIQDMSPDFRIGYRFYTEGEGGRKTMPHQGYRSDFMYADDDDSVFMIWPCFEKSDGSIYESYKAINETGTAVMHIVNDKSREYHKDKIRVGVKGYLVEGKRRVAVCEVLEVFESNIKIINK